MINIVPAGRDAGAYLVSHPGIDKVAFTGSTEAGRWVAERCGSLLRPVTLELGGKSAAVVLEDVDLETFAAQLLGSSFPNNGQTCTASTESWRHDRSSPRSSTRSPRRPGHIGWAIRATPRRISARSSVPGSEIASKATYAWGETKVGA